MMKWRRVPWPLWVYALNAFVGTILIEVRVRGPIPAKVLFPFVMFVWLFFLLKGVRWVWIATVALSILGFAPELISGSLRWRSVVFGLAGLVLLLLSVTRRYFANEFAAADA